LFRSLIPVGASIENANNLESMRTTTVERPKLLKTLLAVGMFVGAAQAYFSQIADYGPAQLARQAVVIRTPYLAQMAQIAYSQKNGKQRSGAGPSRKASVTPKAAPTTFTRSRIGWYKPWAMANELSKEVQWDERAPFGSGFAREEAQRQALTKLFTERLEVYERQSKAEGIPTSAEETFREVARRNVAALKSASLQELSNACSVLGSR
jgi:hypothetical protein